MMTCLAFALAGCSPKPKEVNSGPPAEEAKAPQEKAADPAPPAAADPEPAPKENAVQEGSGPGLIGVVECDSYIMKYRFCARRMASKKMASGMMATIDSYARAWKKAAATEAGRAKLPEACDMARDAAEKSIVAHACTFTRTTGVLACDRYIMRYWACIKDKAPEVNRKALNITIDTMQKAWRQTAATPEGRDGLEEACIAAQEMANKSMAQIGCIW